jgi:hypothetical protein
MNALDGMKMDINDAQIGVTRGREALGIPLLCLGDQILDLHVVIGEGGEVGLVAAVKDGFVVRGGRGIAFLLANIIHKCMSWKKIKYRNTVTSQAQVWARSFVSDAFASG